MRQCVACGIVGADELAHILRSPRGHQHVAEIKWPLKEDAIREIDHKFFLLGGGKLHFHEGALVFDICHAAGYGILGGLVANREGDLVRRTANRKSAPGRASDLSGRR